ncbi:MAG: Subtilase family [Thermoplasmata archaeon]|nr:Subtilase family [Thermoplasmata archaeon]
MRIAVLDTGIDAGHDEFGSRVTRRTFVDPVPVVPPNPLPLPPIDPTGQLPDPDGQGTAVASVAAGATMGQARAALLLDLQVSAQYTGTAADPAREEAAVAAMDYLLREAGGNGTAGPRIALLTFAVQPLSENGAATLAQQARGLWDAGVLPIVPAGAGGPLASSPFVFVVGDQAASCGAPATSPAALLKPDAAGPARNRTVATPGDALGQGRGQSVRDGAELAAATVAGVAAQMWEARPDLPLPALAAILRSTAADAGPAGPDGCTGFGAVQAGAAVAAAKAWTDPVPPGTPLGKTSPAAGVLVALALLAVAGRRR